LGSWSTIAAILVLCFVVLRPARVLAGAAAGPAPGALLAVAFAVAMVLHPAEAFAAAVHGLEVWRNLVFPALLPFFTGPGILLGSGVVISWAYFSNPPDARRSMSQGTALLCRQWAWPRDSPSDRCLRSASFRAGCAPAPRPSVSCPSPTPPTPGSWRTPWPWACSGTGSGRCDHDDPLPIQFQRGLAQALLCPAGAPAPAGQTGASLPAPDLASAGESVPAGPFGKPLGEAVRNIVHTRLLTGGFIIFSVVMRMLPLVGAP